MPHSTPLCLQVDNPVRRFLYRLMTLTLVDYFLVLVVLLSCVEVRTCACPSMQQAPPARQRVESPAGRAHSFVA